MDLSKSPAGAKNCSATPPEIKEPIRDSNNDSITTAVLGIAVN